MQASQSKVTHMRFRAFYRILHKGENTCATAEITIDDKYCFLTLQAVYNRKLKLANISHYVCKKKKRIAIETEQRFIVHTLFQNSACPCYHEWGNMGKETNWELLEVYTQAAICEIYQKTYQIFSFIKVFML